MGYIGDKLEELIEIKGITDKEVLKLSQELDNYIVEYYVNIDKKKSKKNVVFKCIVLKIGVKLYTKPI